LLPRLSDVIRRYDFLCFVVYALFPLPNLSDLGGLGCLIRQSNSSSRIGTHGPFHFFTFTIALSAMLNVSAAD
jgi:hypothetical protein